MSMIKRRSAYSPMPVGGFAGPVARRGFDRNAGQIFSSGTEWGWLVFSGNSRLDHGERPPACRGRPNVTKSSGS
ncbi:hypothetical protein CCHR01_18751 [Colletotrichum chrysophilum]|uniref:Uncharacterized protein n=1 Tax=Colletotrichum chrysophilum TaxID=1836956 RepID=A0AAD8ZZI2_9PEZI|nr:hypothetical protein CCHR01_18751 [Colletotrichum chrysophilum]